MTQQHSVAWTRAYLERKIGPQGLAQEGHLLIVSTINAPINDNNKLVAVAVRCLPLINTHNSATSQDWQHYIYGIGKVQAPYLISWNPCDYLRNYYAFHTDRVIICSRFNEEINYITILASWNKTFLDQDSQTQISLRNKRGKRRTIIIQKNDYINNSTLILLGYFLERPI